jgi:phage terminase small subunit
MKRITTDQRYEKFVEEYLIDFDGTRAAIAVGFSEKTAAQAASRLLKHVKVKALLEKIQAVVVQEKRDEREELRQFLENAKNLDLTDMILMGKTGCSLKEFKEIPKHLRILITEITNVSGGKAGWKINFKVFSKERAVEILARVYGLDKGNGGGITINNFGNMAAIVDSYPDD